MYNPIHFLGISKSSSLGWDERCQNSLQKSRRNCFRFTLYKRIKEYLPELGVNVHKQRNLRLVLSKTLFTDQYSNVYFYQN